MLPGPQFLLRRSLDLGFAGLSIELGILRPFRGALVFPEVRTWGIVRLRV